MNNLTLKNAQDIVENWVSNPDFTVKYFPPFEMIGQLTEEVGEVSREIAHLHGHKKKKLGEKTDGLKSELGDVLFALICIANSEGISLEEAFRDSMFKKTGRDSERFLKKND